MRRSTLAVLGWVAATATAIGVAYAGVNAVAGRVVDPLPPTLALDTASPSTTSGEPTASTPSSTPSPRPRTSTPRPDADVPTPSADPVAPSPASSSTPESEVRSYAMIGGRATLRYATGGVSVVAAEPAQGFRVSVEGAGTDRVEVEFRSDDHRSRLRGEWEDGPRDRVEEHDERGDEAGDRDDERDEEGDDRDDD